MYQNANRGFGHATTKAYTPHRIREIRYEILNTLLEAHSKQEEFDTNILNTKLCLIKKYHRRLRFLLIVKCTEAYLYFIEQGFINNLKEHEQDFIINMFRIDAHDTTIDTICG